MGMTNKEMKIMYFQTANSLVLDSFQSYDERKRQGKKVRRGEKACAYLPMWRPYKIEKDVEKNGEKTSEEFTLFHIQLVAIFHEGQLEGNEGKTLDKTIIENIEKVLKEHGLYNVSKEDYVKNVRAFEKRCKQYDDKVQVEEEKKEEEKKENQELEEYLKGKEELDKKIAEEFVEGKVEEVKKQEEKIDTTSKDNDPDYWF